VEEEGGLIMEFRKNFTKTVYGYASVEANSLKEAEEMFDDGDFDTFDNNSDYEWSSEVTKESD
jgi:hypothetical protein